MTRTSNGWGRRRASTHIALLVTLAMTAGAGAMTTGTAAADTAPTTAADTVVVKPGARFVPRQTRVLNAGETGFLTAREGDDRLRWTDYASGAETVLDERLPKPLEYDPEAVRTRGDWPTGFGQGSDTVAVYADGPSPHVTLRQRAGEGPATVVAIPEGQSYVGTYGTTVLTRTGPETAATGLHLLRATDSGVEDRALEGLPEGWRLTVSEGDARSIVVRAILWEGSTMSQGWWLVDLESGKLQALDEHADAVTLGTDTVLEYGSYAARLLDRDDPSAELRAYDLRDQSYDTSFRMLGNTLVGVLPANPGDNEYRGNPLNVISEDGRTTKQLLAVAHTDLTRTPDGSLLVAGAETGGSEGALDWGYYLFTEAADGTVKRTRVADIEDMPAQPAGIALGSGILTTADDSRLFQPGTYIGAYRSTWLRTSGRPEEIRTTVDGLTSGRDADCGWGGDDPYCVTLFASGDGFHGRKQGTEQDQTMLFRNGDGAWGPRLNTGLMNPELVDLSGRYAVVNEASGNHKKPVEFQEGTDSGTVLDGRDLDAAALWGNTLWSNLPDSPTVTSKNVTTGAAGTSFTTPNKCVPDELQAVGRWVHWSCGSDWPRGAGVYDRQTGKTTTAPDADTLLADGYLVTHEEGAGLTLYDLHAGLPSGGTYADLPRRQLAAEADLDPRGVRRSGWTVDRFGGHVAYTGKDRLVRVVPTGVPASALSVIDTAAPGGSLDLRASAPKWRGSWWLSKPAASWRLTVTNTASGATVRTLTGGEARGLITAAWDGRTAGGAYAPNGAYTWTLSAVPADGVGAALAVSGSVKVTGGAAVARDFVKNDGFGDLLALTSAGRADWRAGTGTGTGRVEDRVSGSGWTGDNTVTAAVPFEDISGDRCNDVLVRTKAGELRAYKPGCGAALTPSTPYRKIGTGWNMFDALTSPGDMSGDGRADLLGRTPEGDLYFYRGRGDGLFEPRVKIGYGWQKYLLAGMGDMDGDGLGDLFARDRSGNVWRYPATGHGTLGARVKLGYGWTMYDTVVGSGDLNGDGRADLLARDTSGVLWSYRGTAQGTLAARTKVGGAWEMYQYLF
ncbi:FG-GAP-like repeat-containing protein [Streptomyces sp. OfavH-34-F]|uniref:FG-GAP-like repeat-containing protein n=1 Tax=Streptomyces sp. OfavH-34-F TaxID=2917760 RepID=UPI001EF1DF71|nr:FG-GAP-like repeat-containing protein [Streptomyces sp. OfavH-34-F]MCG7527487.1 FG-GAP-like repeat-containing protein [Streptomyces sp. OfavH-34-F]